jgi:predicted SprT family Zn-dependent metalloprotease
MPPTLLCLQTEFSKINGLYFDGFLEVPHFRWNTRLRTSSGRFLPGSRQYWQECPPIIEIATYLTFESNARLLVYDTMAHEMIHYWLWVRQRPYGHTLEFLAKMKQMGVSRYNPVPRSKRPTYRYRCQQCQKTFSAQKELGILACASCCQQFSHGRFDARFRLVLSSDN